MRILAGYTPATSGRAFIAGFDVAADSMRARQALGYLPENAPLYLAMTVREYLQFMGEIKRCPKIGFAKTLNLAIEECGLGEVANRIIGTLSKGFRQRVGLAQAILGDPAALILDEPTVGLDPRQIAEIRRLVKSMAGKRTVLISTHILPEVSMICDKVAVLSRGKIVASGTPQKLVSGAQKDSAISAIVKGDSAKAKEILSRVEGVLEVEIESHAIASASSTFNARIKPAPSADPRGAISRALIEAGFELLEMETTGASLEEVFLRVISSAEREHA